MISVFLGWDFTIAIYPCFVMGILCFAFGWVKQDGIPMEKILLKKLQTNIYQNDIRVYKTKNRYTVMLNREYDRRRQMDCRDKKLKKAIRKEEKEKQKSKLKKIA